MVSTCSRGPAEQFWTLYDEGDKFQTLYGEVIFRTLYGEQANLGHCMVSVACRGFADQFWTLYGEGDGLQTLYGGGG